MKHKSQSKFTPTQIRAIADLINFVSAKNSLGPSGRIERDVDHDIICEATFLDLEKALRNREIVPYSTKQTLLRWARKNSEQKSANAYFKTIGCKLAAFRDQINVVPPLQ